jgi:TolB-like protein/tetratricopeptide (TPR) repeat protein
MDDSQPKETDEIRAKLEATLADRYAIERPLGEGGMAFVYLATDVKHEREVAIKVLKPELAASLGAERFLREIRITAKLQHPNILPLYDSGEADGVLYYVMPFVVGESLSDLIAREKQLAIPDAVQIAREVAEALSHAHTFGLVHRDIKPDNVMMSNGHAIVADFGIARAMSEAGGDKITQTGMAVGTPAYMSPEQAAGDPGVDGRTDIYSLGCMLFEMLVGQIPFTGPNAMAIMARHTMDHVTPPSIMRDSIPPELENVVLHAMEKTPADRYRTALEMVEDLKAIEQGRVSVPTGRASQMGMRASQMGMRASQMGMRASQMGMRASQMGVAFTTGDFAPRRRWPLVAGIGGAAVVALGVVGWLVFGRGGGPTLSPGGALDFRNVAVLPFDDLSSDSSLGYVADGITDGLIDQLSRVDELTVVSRSGVAPYRGSNLPRDSIGRALHSGTIVVGSVEPAGKDVRVSARLVDGNSGADLARASFQLPRSNLLAVRDSVAGTVAGFLRPRIGNEVRLRELRGETRSPEAWELLQRGLRVRREMPDTSSAARLARLALADSLFQAAASADGNWPEPKIQMGWVALDRAALESGRAARPFYERAIALADTVLASTPQQARFHYYTAKITDNPSAWRQLLTDAQSDLEASVTADPSLATAHLTLTRLYYWTDNVTGALIEAQKAYAADAYLEHAAAVIARTFWAAIDLKQFGTAETWCARGAERAPTDPQFVTCRLWLMITPSATPDPALAWQLVARLDTLRATQQTRIEAQLLTGGILARAHLLDSADRVLDRVHAEINPEIDPELELIAREALVRSIAGQQDKAIDLLKEAVAANPDHDFASAANQVWWWDDLRKNPRWKELERK